MRLSVVAIVGCFGLISAAMAESPVKDAPRSLRVMVFNVWELSLQKLRAADAEGRGADPQVRKAAEIVQIVRPDVLVINEIDYAPAEEAVRLLRDKYLAVGQREAKALTHFEHVFTAPVNTGEPTAFDLDNDGKTGGPGDAYGFGKYPGQYGMALLSRYPIDAASARTFQKLLWREMPGNLMPDGSEGKPAFYSSEEAAALRLSSKSHWDVPVRVDEKTVVHVLMSHPTPPVFDGPEDWNGRRNFDEIRLWADYIDGDEGRAAYIVDDAGKRGGLARDALFVITGDQNSDPKRGDHPYGKPAISQLLEHPRVRDCMPRSRGGEADNSKDAQRRYPADATLRTSNFGRIDYLLPCREIECGEAAVFWPGPEEKHRELISEPNPASDHRAIWGELILRR
ncbi:MAG: endonuclease/exonuclease/phosphatase family protein [Phycisphaerae bacterium]|nr:endonuclease/exonuclease/phosphatase family protein [Phycisphaerae bacterium]